MIGTDILACRAGTSALELVANSWKNASRFSETRKALDLIERFERPVYHSGVNFTRSSKSVNLPSLKKMNIDMEHILGGHMEGSSKIIQGANKTLFPQNLNKDQIKKMIEEAYKNGKKMKTRAGNILVEGNSQGEKIHMWVNPKTKTIETAYPVK